MGYRNVYSSAATYFYLFFLTSFLEAHVSVYFEFTLNGSKFKRQCTSFHYRYFVMGYMFQNPPHRTMRQDLETRNLIFAMYLTLPTRLFQSKVVQSDNMPRLPNTKTTFAKYASLNLRRSRLSAAWLQHTSAVASFISEKVKVFETLEKHDIDGTVCKRS